MDSKKGLQSSSPRQTRQANGKDSGVVSVGIQHSLEWNVETYKVPSGKKGKLRSILSNIAGKTVSGELTAIMGPSGCGKTTLLECISLRNRRFDGTVHFDGKAPGGDAFTVSVLVHQKELLFGFMTPREYLIFHALARMERTHTRAEIDKRIEEVLLDMKLDKCADTLVGGTDPFFQKKGLSGGERKRLAIAYEMLLAPSMVFLDEPSSGLDSVMSESVSVFMRKGEREKRKKGGEEEENVSLLGIGIRFQSSLSFSSSFPIPPTEIHPIPPTHFPNK